MKRVDKNKKKAVKAVGEFYRFGVFDVFNVIVMILLCAIVIIPFWDMLMRSFSSASGGDSLTIVWWPENFNLDSYRYLLRNDEVLNAYMVTIARTLIGSLLQIIMSMMTGYVLARKNLPYRTFITVLIIIPMFFSGGSIASYLMYRQINLINTFWVYILPGAFGSYNALLARNYIMSLDSGLEESARIDGAGYMTIFVRIILPLCKPIVATFFLWAAVGHWSAWYDSLVYTRDPSLTTVQLLLRRLLTLTNTMSNEMQDFAQSENMAMLESSTVRYAMIFISIAPILCVYPFIQKHFVKGIMVGSLKG